MNLGKLKKIGILSLGALTLVIIAFGVWLAHLYSEMADRFDRDWFLPPVEIYSAPRRIHRGEKLVLPEFAEQLARAGFRELRGEQRLRDDDFSVWDLETCKASASEPLPEATEQCLVLRKGERAFGPRRPAELHLLALGAGGEILEIYSGQPFQVASALVLEPRLFAQFYEGQPILREIVTYGEIPLPCLQAITAIEDSRFLEHRGVSFTGLLRAFFRNVQAGRVAEGGSTITQQLVKNYFLTSERSFRRKFKELFMAMILEMKLEKEQILENYLNVIYMGQNGPFQIRGYGAAARHYFGRPVGELDVPSCALLAAIVNSPGRYNPFTSKEPARERRNLVLQRMADLAMIEAEQQERGKQASLPDRPPRILSEPAPYFVQAVNQRLEQLGFENQAGLRVFTTLDVEAQEAAQSSVRDGLKALETENKKIKALFDQGKRLEALMISVDLKSGGITSLVGGRGFKETQYNRALVAHRQVGSIMKPFVYLAALETTTPDGSAYTPLTPIADAAFTHRYERQKWSPQNYDRKFRGTIPLFFGLKNSLNASTARLALDVGLENVIDVAKRAGIRSRIDPLPALSLGAFELFPMEVAEAYATVARFGSRPQLYVIESVESFSGDVLHQNQAVVEQSFAADTAAVLVGMLKQTILTGSGQSISTWRGFHHPSAGKTGTTSDTKDAWFAGFTPYVLSVAWVGYDDNTPHGLTGASGAIPIWTEFMKRYAIRFPPTDFPWPESTTRYLLPKDQLATQVEEAHGEELKDTELIFRAGEAP